ncbi:hypothetical protein CAEBREN_18768 [Caenorhabditis brenneri]|uniref:F-box domain-containing protein n=1 Tax=Caenorhabditis brenneri TaxID=135651 RepID=G0N076_CAEBE|nr:hypothetical protein CAEBREN_18768 [Caenorhabditis brenneri]
MSLSKFPLSELPVSTQQFILRTWDPPELIEYSLLSEKCKNLVNSVHVDKGSIDVYISGDIFIDIRNSSIFYLRCTFYEDESFNLGMENYEVKKHLESPGSVQLTFEGAEEYVEDIDFNMKEWLEHLQFIFNCPEISDIVCGVKSSEFDIDCLTKVFKGCTKIDTEDWKSTDFNRKFLGKILIDKPSLYSDFFEDSKVPNSLLIQNFEYLWIHFPSGANSILDQLLMINSKYHGHPDIPTTPTSSSCPSERVASVEYPRIESFRKADICNFKHGGRNAFNEDVFKEFAPTKVTFYNDYFLDFRVPSKILIKNFDRMSIFNDPTDRFQVHLRHLLLMNTKVISIRNVHITRRALNKFIKLWQRGSSPQLEYIRVFRQNVNRRLLKMVMRRVNYQFAPDEEIFSPS